MRFSRMGVSILVALAIAACGSETTEPTDQTVSVQDDVFNPLTANVTVGGTVTWNWSGSNQHNVTFTDPLSAGGTAPASTTQAGGSYQLTFNTAGTYDYYCTIHGTAQGVGMAGTVTVN